MYNPVLQPLTERWAPTVLVVCPLKLLGLCAGAHLHQHPSPRLQDWGLRSQIYRKMTEDHTSPRQVPPPPWEELSEV